MSATELRINVKGNMTRYFAIAAGETLFQRGGGMATGIPVVQYIPFRQAACFSGCKKMSYQQI